MNPDFLKEVYFGNTVSDYFWLAGLMLIGVIFVKFLSRILSNFIYRLFEKYTEGIDQNKFYELMHKPLSWLILLILSFIATNHIEFPNNWNLANEKEFGLRMVLNRTYLTFVGAVVIWILLRLADFLGLILLKKAEKTESKADDQLIPFAIEFIKIILISLGIFAILGTVFNVNVGSLIAGLGIGGLALALAAKESLENLFGSFTIFFDQPFVVGDSVKIGNVTGTVEKVGFRSTRIRTLDKTLITVPNKKMIDAELDNLTDRTMRREIINFGVLYSTKKEKMTTIVADLQNYLNNHPLITEDSIVTFDSFGDSALNIRALFIIKTNDETQYRLLKQEINFSIMDIVQRNNSDFAYPTQTVYFKTQ